MQEVFRAIGRLSQSSATVLITGESGTGKELVARALHRHSPRAAQPFVAINTAAIPKDLLESELFGHERGSFTGAQPLRRGRFEQAEGGTLFLDEIGDMPPDLQTRLLRVLSDGKFYRVGGHQPIKANVRVIAATHQNLEERVREGLFREDLYHRLNVIRLRLPPPARARRGHPAARAHFLPKSAKQLGVEPKRLADDALAHLARLDFPGNVRQLENLCHWLTVMAPGQVIDVADLPPEFRDQARRAAPAPTGSRRSSRKPSGASRAARPASSTRSGASSSARSSARRSRSTGGRRIEAANLLGMGRNTLTRKIQELGIEDNDAGQFGDGALTPSGSFLPVELEPGVHQAHHLVEDRQLHALLLGDRLHQPVDALDVRRAGEERARGGRRAAEALRRGRVLLERHQVLLVRAEQHAEVHHPVVDRRARRRGRSAPPP